MSGNASDKNIDKKLKELQKEISNLKKENCRLSALADKYYNLFENAFDPIFVLDRNHNYIEVNKRATEIFGFNKEEFLEMSILNVIPEEKKDISKNELLKLNKDGFYEKFIGKMRRSDNEYIDIEVSSSSLIDKKGKNLGSIDIVRDITKKLQNEKELENLKNQIENILEVTNTHFDIIDENLYLQYVDPVNVKKLGNYNGKKCFEYYKGRDTQCNNCGTKQAFESKKKVVTEDLLLYDEEYPVQITSIPFLNEKGQWLVAEVRIDITEKKEAQKALEESEKKYRQITDTAKDAIVMIDDQGRVTFWNPAAEQYFGYTKEEVLGLDFHSLCVPYRYHSNYCEGIKKFRNTGEGLVIGKTLEMSALRKDKTEFPIEISFSRIKHGNNWQAIGILRDISDRKKIDKELSLYRNNLEDLVQIRTEELTRTNEILVEKIKKLNEAEEAKLRSEHKYQRLVENLKEDYFLYSHSRNGIYKYVSESVRNVLGYSPDEFHKHFSAFITDNSTNDKIAIYKSLCMEGFSQPSYEIEAYHKNGDKHWLEISEVPIFDRWNKVVGVEGIAHDITHRKKMEMELLKAQKIESTGVLAGGIAHDFNNMLTAILGNISLAKLYADPDSKVYKKLTETEKASWRAKNLTQQLLTFSKGGAPLIKTESITDLIRDSTWFTLRGTKTKSEFEIDEDLWPVEVDEGQFCQVVQNIATNASQAMPDGGGLQVKAENVVIDDHGNIPLPSGRYVKIVFTDTGKGISEEFLNKIFDPYFTTKDTGSGLGLAICYSIIKNHSGLMLVQSKLECGTSFYIYLPASEPDVEIKKDIPMKIIKGHGKILIMDDEEIVQEIGQEMLSHLGYDSVIAGDGNEAIRLYIEARDSGQPFDAVIMDLTIPGGMGGKETIEKLLEYDPGIKSIVSSGYANDQILAKYKNYGFKAIIPKPYKIEELSAVLDKLING